MTELKDIKKGDRVKAVNENGDTAEFTVRAVESLYAHSEVNVFALADGWSFEKIAPPLPTEPGFYRCEHGALCILDDAGAWVAISPAAYFVNVDYSPEDKGCKSFRRVEIEA